MSGSYSTCGVPIKKNYGGLERQAITDKKEKYYATEKRKGYKDAS